MTVFNDELTMEGRGSLIAKHKVLNTVNDHVAATPDAEIDFTWTPVGDAVTVTVGATVYTPADTSDGGTSTHSTYYYTDIDTPITFTADVTLPSGVSPVLYHWNFGDGDQGWGSSVVHTYRTPTQVWATLRVTDEEGQTHFAARQVNLASP